MLKPALITIYIFLNWLYLPLSKRTIKYYWRTRIDDKIPLIPWMVVPYISYFFLFLGGGLILILSRDYFAFIKAMIAAQLTADIIWYLFPNGVRRPTVSGQGLMVGWLRKLYAFDRHDGNGAPSAHAFHAVIVSYFLANQLPAWAGVIYVWAGLILASTVLVKQHYFLDLAAGILLAAIVIWV